MWFERHIVFWVFALAVFIGLIWLLSPILLPFVAGMAIAYVLDPIVNRLERMGMSRLVAALVILGLFVLVFVALLLIIAPVLATQLVSFLDNLPGYTQRIQNLVSDPKHTWLRHILGDKLEGADKSMGDLMNQATGYITGALTSVWTKGQALISLFSLLVITPVVAFYLICDWDRMLATVDSWVPLTQRETVHGLAREIDDTISAYVRGQTGVCLILGAYYAAGLTLTGLSFGLLIGIISGFISFIPYVGSMTGLVLSLGVAVAQFFPNWTPILIVLGIFLFGQFLEGNVLAPKLVGKSVGLHPVWLMFALLAFGYLFGFLGLLVAVPMAAATGVLVRFALRRYLASPLYTGAGPG
jgi:predicted PurR-regulated permease PerM